MKYTLALILSIFFALNANASHLYGGSMTYECNGNSRYTIYLTLHKECASVVPFDPTAAIGVYDSSGTTLINRFYMNLPQTDTLTTGTFDPCLGFPSAVCVEKGVYSQSIKLAPRKGGYVFVYQRCCRPTGITNIQNSVQEGNTFSCHVPDPGLYCNSSPQPNFERPLAFCLGKPFQINRSYTDLDGDSIAYALATPIVGGGTNQIQVNAPNGPIPDPPSAPPFDTIQWRAGYSQQQPVGPNNTLNINPVTGILHGTLTTVGIYTVAIEVSEYRNGKEIGTYYEEILLKTVNCLENVEARFASQKDKCEGKLLTFNNTSTIAQTFFWDFGDTILSDTSRLKHPTYNFKDTGVYQVQLIANPGLSCADTVTQEVFVYPELDIRMTGLTEKCISNPSFSFQMTGKYAPYVNIEWDFTDLGAPSKSNTLNAHTFYPREGYYPVVLRASQGPCQDSVIRNAVVFPRPNSDFALPDTTLCLPQTIKPIPVSQEWPGLIYHWKINGQETNEQYPEWEIDTSGLHLITLRVEQTKGCIGNSLTQERRIVLEPVPIANFETDKESYFLSEANISIEDQKSNAEFCSYYINDTLQDQQSCSFDVEIDSPGRYSIMQVVDNYGLCPDTIVKQVEVTKDFDYFIPKAFSPNGDGINDTYKVEAFGILDFKMRVFNRWGEPVFVGERLSDEWNGSDIRGKKCLPDVYVYRITMTNRLQEEIIETGNITLLE